jgi:uncharacterized protein (TIGR00255 family)
MIRSMTGYGAAEHLGEKVRIAVEVKTLNNRFLKLNLRAPEGFGPIELEIERLVREHMTRGTVNLNLVVEPRGEAARAPINLDVLMAYARDLEPLQREFAVTTDGKLDLGWLLELPGVVGSGEQLLTGIDGLPQMVLRVVREALERLDAMRAAEGEATARDMEAALGEIERHIAAIEARSPALIEEFRDRLRQRVALLLQGAEVPLDDPTLAREVAFYADRSDINEELKRLASHADQFRALISESGPGGRKLEFLTQEMHREINTLGSKSSDSQVSRDVVEIKVRVDRLREQAQNVE